jgi:hypothetical protein
LFKTIAESRTFLLPASTYPLADLISRFQTSSPKSVFHPPPSARVQETDKPFYPQLLFGLKITFIFVALLFTDAVNQMLKIHREREMCVSFSSFLPLI